jgi:phage shock protein A
MVKVINASIKLAEKEVEKSKRQHEKFLVTQKKLKTEIDNYNLQLEHLSQKDKDALKKNRNISESERYNL